MDATASASQRQAACTGRNQAERFPKKSESIHWDSYKVFDPIGKLRDRMSDLLDGSCSKKKEKPESEKAKELRWIVILRSNNVAW